MIDPEERIVAELETLGVRYLSRQTTVQVGQVRSPVRFLADLIRQPNSRMRTALIAVLLAHPDFSRSISAASRQLNPADQIALKLLYTAAVVLQKKYSERLRPFLTDCWQWLPDLYSSELGLTSNQSPDEILNALGIVRRQKTGAVLNWIGTYENVAHHLLHRWELEKQWSQQPQRL